ncbi:hypothetical protein bthur0002_57430 [Bacillus thuringiensis Bt407]|nr:hypothetical protein bthur0002_57430 [Bacillus thuringiensis Bt407]
MDTENNRIKHENKAISFLCVDMNSIHKEIKDVRNSQY